jgi:hypothetical protein
MAIKTFTTGEVLTAADTNTYLANSGLVYVTSASVGTASTSVTIANCFSSTYDNYRITLAGGVASGNYAIGLRLGPTSVTGYNTSYYAALNYLTWAGTAGNARDNNFSKWTYVGAGEANQAVMCVDVLQPFLTKYTTYGAQYMDSGLTGPTGGSHQVASSFSGITVLIDSGTMTGGTVTVYGYRKA